MIIIQGCSDEVIEDNNDGLCGRHELLPETTRALKWELANIFVTVALGSDFGSGIPVVKKWQKPVKIFIKGSYTDDHLSELESVINDINDLLTGFMTVEQVQDSTDSNMIAFFGSKSEYINLFPEAQHELNNAIGFFVIHHNKNFEIESGHIFIDVHNTTIQIQKHILREELTQSLGLPNDIGLPNSMFYDKPSNTTTYSNEDKELLRMLYRPEILPGMNEGTVRSVITDLLCI